MLSKRGALVVLLVMGMLSAIGIPAYRHFTWVEQDFGPLTGYEPSQQYDELIERVQAAAVPESGYKFVVLGDTRSNIGAARDVVGESMKERPSFILHTGDLVRRGTVGEYLSHHLKLLEKAPETPMIPVPGNHELGPNRDFGAYKALFGNDRFSFDYGNCRFVGFNTGSKIRVTSGDLDFLHTELSKPGVDHRFVMFHVPPSYMKSSIEAEEGRGFSWNAKKLHKIMVMHEVTQVFVGHVHGFASEVIDGVRYTITGGGGAPIATTLGEEGNVRNYVVVYVSADGVRTEVVKLVDESWQRAELP
jgi:predicted phosphodiesterase